MTRKYLLFIISFFLLSLCLYLLWPLRSKEFEISWDESLIASKQDFLLFQPVTQKKQLKPNIILIIVDDLGKTDISLYGPGKVYTPNIDRMGAEGVIFHQAYVTSPICSPSRASIMTGRYPQRFGFVHQMHEFYIKNRLQYYGFKYFIDSYPFMPRELEPQPDEKMAEKQGLPPSEITLPELLKKQGYMTALVGKWHLGEHSQNVPCNFGFDYQYGFYASHSLYAIEDDPVIVDVKNEGDFSDAHIWGGQRNGPHAIYRNCELIEEKEYLTDAITRECKDFIRSNADTSFFLIASYNAPHTPFQAPASYVKKFEHIKDRVKKVYYAMISSLDDAVGELQDYLRKLNIEDNTLIFFISDNGGATYTHATDNYPLKGGKVTDFEGGINVPFIMKWKQYIPSGMHYDNPVSSMDIFGTITSILNIHLPEDRTYDGVNLIPYFMEGNYDEMPHEYLYWYREDTRAIRSKHWKMIWNEKFKEKVLFRMIDDNLEKTDVIAGYPQIARDLEKEYGHWMKDLKDPLWPPLVDFVFEEDGRTYHFDD